MNTKKIIAFAIIIGLSSSIALSCDFVILNESKYDNIYLTSESHPDRVEVPQKQKGTVHGMWFKIESKDSKGEFTPLLLGKIHRCDMNPDHNALTYAKNTVKYTCTKNTEPKCSNETNKVDTTRYEIIDLTKKSAEKKVKNVTLEAHEPIDQQSIENAMPAQPEYLTEPGGYQEILP